MRNLSDEDLGFIKKKLSLESPETIAQQLKLPIKDFYLARQGLTGDDIPSFFILNRGLIQKLYAGFFATFILYLLVATVISHDDIFIKKLSYLLPLSTFLLGLFFLKFLLFFIIFIEHCPFAFNVLYSL